RRRDLRHNRWRRQQRPRHRIQIEQGRECLSRPLQLQWRRRRWALWAIGGRARRRALRHDIKTRRKRCGRGVQVEQGREQLSRSAQLQWQRRRVALWRTGRRERWCPLRHYERWRERWHGDGFQAEQEWER